MPYDEQRACEDDLNAEDMRLRVLASARIAGDEEAVTRISRTGSAGWPSTDELKYCALVLEGSIHEVRMDGSNGRFVFAHGVGPVLMCVKVCDAVDGAGHKSPHFELAQSWMPVSSYVRRWGTNETPQATQRLLMQGSPLFQKCFAQEGICQGHLRQKNFSGPSSFGTRRKYD